MTSNLDCVESDNGVILPVKVFPGANKNGVRGVVGGRLKIGITAAAEKGKANTALVKWISKTFNIPKSRILIAVGAKTREKSIELIGVDLAKLESMLKPLVPEGN